MRTKEEIAIYQKEYRKKNKERLKENSKKYREENKEILKEKKQIYDKERREKLGSELNKKNLEYYYENRDVILDKHKTYRELNKDKINNRNKERRDLKKLENPVDDLIKGSYNITLAERNKEFWLKEDLYFYKLKLIEDGGTIFYKYGLSVNVKERIYKIPYDCEILESILMTKYDAIWMEYNSLKLVNRYTPQKIFRGYTECFN